MKKTPNWKTLSFEAVVQSRGSGSTGLAQKDWMSSGRYPVIGQGAEEIEGWTDREDLLLTPVPAVVLYGGHTRRAKHVSQPFVPGPNVKILQPIPEINTKFLFYFLTQLQIKSKGYADHFPLVRKSKVPVPPFTEQERIVKLLNEADELRKLRAQADQRSASLIPALFHEMFGNPTTNEKGWDVAELGTLCLTMYRYPTFYGIEYVDRGVPLARIGNITEHGILDPDLSHYVFIPQEISSKFPRTILERFDIVMAVRGDGSTGKRIGLVTSANLYGANISPNLLRFKTNENVLNPLYLFHLMVSKQGQALIERRITRTAKKTITARDIAAMKIPIPPIQRQRAFAQQVIKIRELETDQLLSRQRLEDLFQSMLHRAFNGEL